MRNKLNRKAPVVIGGVGGSGTRLVAGILMELGFFMGSDLNQTLDNLSFTMLFKRPLWYRKNIQTLQRQTRRGFRILTRSLTARFPLMLNPFEICFFLQAALDTYRFGLDYSGNSKGAWVLQRAFNIIRFKNLDPGRFTGWGWKEPNSHIFLEYLAHHFPEIKFVHVIRHGLDMAYSGNQGQLHNWGYIWDITADKIEKNPHGASLDYWIQANQRAVHLGKTIGENRFLLLNYDRLCASPENELSRLFSFLDIEPADTDMEHFSNKIIAPKSIGRYRQYDINVFEERQKDCVREMGFCMYE